MYVLLFLSLYFEVFLLVSFVENGRNRRGNIVAGSGVADLPTVAIVVPCYNEETSIKTTLSSLAALEYPRGKLEVIVVDDGSSDDTLAVARSFSEHTNIRVFHKANGGKHTAMNFALEHTEAELIGCLDADSVVDANALLEIVPVFAHARIAAATPGIHVREPHTLLQHMQNVEYHLSIFNRFTSALLGSIFITPGPFSFFRTSVVRELGGWRHGHSTEDMEMALRIQAAGHLIANVPRAVVHTTTPRTLGGLYHQRVRWTYGWLRNAVDYRFMVGNRAYGNLGIIMLPTALLSIATGIYFFVRTAWYAGQSLIHEIVRVQVTGGIAHPSFDAFYLNTSVFWLLTLMGLALILVLISAGTFIGTGRRVPPASTPVFLLLYSFIAPIWLCAALVRATFRTGVRWR